MQETLNAEMRRVVAAAALACPAQLGAAALPPLPPTASGAWLGAWVDDDRRAWTALLQLAEVIERADAQARSVHARRGALAQERDALDQHRLEIERLRTMRTTTEQELTAARQTVAQFNEANSELIETVTAEVPVVPQRQSK